MPPTPHRRCLVRVVLRVQPFHHRSKEVFPNLNDLQVFLTSLDNQSSYRPMEPTCPTTLQNGGLILMVLTSLLILHPSSRTLIYPTSLSPRIWGLRLLALTVMPLHHLASFFIL